jgi:hypothetical protein
MKIPTRKLLVVAVAAVAVALGGVALASAAGTASTPSAFMESLAKHLGISTEKLQDAAKAAAIDQIDAALAEGKITEQQANAAKERIQSGETPFLLGPRFGHGPGFGGHGFGHGPHHFGGLLEAAAEYLGLTEAELREQLESGKSLAAVAESEGKSTDGLKDALHAAVEEDLGAAVDAGRITQAQADEALQRFDERVDDLIARVPGERPDFGRLRARGPIF